MKVFNKIVDLQNALFLARKQGKKIGLVPTMGALHEGHASLITKSIGENDITVVSVFLNPTQFNDQSDFDRYPRTLEADSRLVEACGADYIFAPSVKDIYPSPDARHFEFPPVTTVMEGARRPGHFNGVCQVVSRVVFILRPATAYFWEKDCEQNCLVKQNWKNINSNVRIVECPIIRDPDGLAKSSRNSLLTKEERAIAPAIYQILSESVGYAETHSLKETRNMVVERINAIPELEVEYFEIVDGDSLLPVENWERSEYIVGCITVYCGKTPIRLIDHIRYKDRKNKRR